MAFFKWQKAPTKKAPKRSWSKGNNPKTAVREFLDGNTDKVHRTTAEFEIDTNIQDKLLLTVAPNGFLRRIK